jgi:hypothetical protein
MFIIKILENNEFSLYVLIFRGPKEIIVGVV